jgi:hypothetical protein
MVAISQPIYVVLHKPWFRTLQASGQNQFTSLQQYMLFCAILLENNNKGECGSQRLITKWGWNSLNWDGLNKMSWWARLLGFKFLSVEIICIWYSVWCRSLTQRQHKDFFHIRADMSYRIFRRFVILWTHFVDHTFQTCPGLQGGILSLWFLV